MIPKVIPPCTGLTVLVTRPAAQAESLCAHIEAAGATALRFPAIAIEPTACARAEPFDLAVFVSVNAVAHGRHLLPSDGSSRVAAIGSATAAALREAGVRVDFVPQAEATSESLLSLPELMAGGIERVLIVRGAGGRELMRQTFEARGLQVQTREVYRRVRPTVEDTLRDSIEAHWLDPGIDVVTATSVETLRNLDAMLTECGRNLLRRSALLVASRRIWEAALQIGAGSEGIVAGGADDVSMMRALARWCARAR